MKTMLRANRLKGKEKIFNPHFHGTRSSTESLWTQVERGWMRGCDQRQHSFHFVDEVSGRISICRMDCPEWAVRTPPTACGHRPPVGVSTNRRQFEMHPSIHMFPRPSILPGYPAIPHDHFFRRISITRRFVIYVKFIRRWFILAYDSPVFIRAGIISFTIKSRGIKREPPSSVLSGADMQHRFCARRICAFEDIIQS